MRVRYVWAGRGEVGWRAFYKKDRLTSQRNLEYGIKNFKLNRADDQQTDAARDALLPG